MPEKIYNIGDFKKEEAQAGGKGQLPQKPAALRTPYVRPDEMNPDEIQIEDPMNFLTSEEKQEYIKAHQEAILRNNAVGEVRSGTVRQQVGARAQYMGQRASNQGPYQGDPRYSYQNNGYNNRGNNQYGSGGYNDQQGQGYSDGYEDDYYEQPYDDGYNGNYDQGDYYGDPQGYPQGYSDEMYQDQADYEEYAEDMQGGEDKMAIITKILAGVTALLIIIIATMFIFNKVNDPAKEKETGDEFAYTGDNTVSEENGDVEDDQTQAQEEVNGTPVYTTSGLNLRTSPEKTDTNKAMSVESGTELIYVGEENGWAKVYYQGQYYYCSKAYLSPTK